MFRAIRASNVIGHILVDAPHVIDEVIELSKIGSQTTKSISLSSRNLSTKRWTNLGGAVCEVLGRRRFLETLPMDRLRLFCPRKPAALLAYS